MLRLQVPDDHNIDNTQLFNKIVLDEINRAQFYDSMNYTNLFTDSVIIYVQNHLQAYLKKKLKKVYNVNIHMPYIYINNEPIFSLPHCTCRQLINALLNNITDLEKECDQFIAYMKKRKNIIMELKQYIYDKCIPLSCIINKSKLTVSKRDDQDNIIRISVYYDKHILLSFRPFIGYTSNIIHEKEKIDEMIHQSYWCMELLVARYIYELLCSKAYYKINRAEQEFFVNTNLNADKSSFVLTNKAITRLDEDLQVIYKAKRAIYQLK